MVFNYIWLTVAFMKLKAFEFKLQYIESFAIFVINLIEIV